MKSLKNIARSISPFTSTKRKNSISSISSDKNIYTSFSWDLANVDLFAALQCFYQDYGPEKLPTISEILANYENEEITLLQHLCERYQLTEVRMREYLDRSIVNNRDSMSSSLSKVSGSTTSPLTWDLAGVDFEMLLTKIYTDNNPEKIPHINEILIQFKDEELHMLRNLCTRYFINASTIQNYIDQSKAQTIPPPTSKNDTKNSTKNAVENQDTPLLTSKFYWDITGIDIPKVLKLVYNVHNPDKTPNLSYLKGKSNDDIVTILQQLCKRHKLSESDMQKYLDQAKKSSTSILTNNNIISSTTPNIIIEKQQKNVSFFRSPSFSSVQSNTSTVDIRDPSLKSNSINPAVSNNDMLTFNVMAEKRDQSKSPKDESIGKLIKELSTRIDSNKQTGSSVASNEDKSSVPTSTNNFETSFQDNRNISELNNTPKSLPFTNASPNRRESSRSSTFPHINGSTKSINIDEEIVPPMQRTSSNRAFPSQEVTNSIPPVIPNTARQSITSKVSVNDTEEMSIMKKELEKVRKDFEELNKKNHQMLQQVRMNSNNQNVSIPSMTIPGSMQEMSQHKIIAEKLEEITEQYADLQQKHDDLNITIAEKNKELIAIREAYQMTKADKNDFIQLINVLSTNSLGINKNMLEAFLLRIAETSGVSNNQYNFDQNGQELPMGDRIAIALENKRKFEKNQLSSSSSSVQSVNDQMKLAMANNDIFSFAHQMNQVNSPSRQSSPTQSPSKRQNEFDSKALENQYELAKKLHMHQMTQNKIANQIAATNLNLQQNTTTQVINQSLVKDQKIMINPNTIAYDWTECYDPKSKRKYYYSATLHKSTWTRPSNMDNMSQSSSRASSPATTTNNNNTFQARGGLTPSSTISPLRTNNSIQQRLTNTQKLINKFSLNDDNNQEYERAQSDTSSSIAPPSLKIGDFDDLSFQSFPSQQSSFSVSAFQNQIQTQYYNNNNNNSNNINNSNNNVNFPIINNVANNEYSYRVEGQGSSNNLNNSSRPTSTQRANILQSTTPQLVMTSNNNNNQPMSRSSSPSQLSLRSHGSSRSSSPRINSNSNSVWVTAIDPKSQRRYWYN
eukprot:gene8748-11820_t